MESGKSRDCRWKGRWTLKAARLRWMGARFKQRRRLARGILRECDQRHEECCNANNLLNGLPLVLRLARPTPLCSSFWRRYLKQGSALDAAIQGKERCWMLTFWVWTGGDCWGKFRAVAIPIEHTVTQVEENGQLTLQAHRV